MSDLLGGLGELFSWARFFDFLRAGFVVVLFGLVTWVLDRRLRKAAEGGPRAQQVLVLRRAVGGVLVSVGLAIALNQLGFRLTALLGAAGIMTVALGFAAQTSVSNVISGVFLLGERPFSVGDVITVGDTSGEVIAIDLLSVKLRTFDNLRVRIPNETMLKAQVTTQTAYPIRRLELNLGVGCDTDLARMRAILLDLADANPYCLADPAPIYVFSGFGDHALDIQLLVWATREHLLDLRNGLLEEIKQAFEAEGIEMPFPTRTVRLVESSAE